MPQRIFCFSLVFLGLLVTGSALETPATLYNYGFEALCWAAEGQGNYVEPDACPPAYPIETNFGAGSVACNLQLDSGFRGCDPTIWFADQFNVDEKLYCSSNPWIRLAVRGRAPIRW